MMIVYSVLIGGYDDFLTTIPLCPEKCECKYILLTDRPSISVSGWEVRLIKGVGEPFLESRKLKIIPHSVFNDFNVPTLYLDANIRLQKCPCYLFKKYRNGEILTIPLHPHRNCVYDELDVFSKNLRWSKAAENVKLFLLNIQFPKKIGLTENGIFLVDRSSERHRQIMNEWFNMVKKYKCRDQFVLIPTLWKSGVKYRALEEGPRNGSSFFYFQPHKHDRVMSLGQKIRFRIRSAPNASMLNKFLFKILDKL